MFLDCRTFTVVHMCYVSDFLGEKLSENTRFSLKNEVCVGEIIVAVLRMTLASTKDDSNKTKTTLVLRPKDKSLSLVFAS